MAGMAIASFIGFLAALWAWDWIERRRRAKLTARGMAMLHTDPRTLHPAPHWKAK